MRGDEGTALSFLAARLQGKIGDGGAPSEIERKQLLSTLQALIQQTSTDTLISTPITGPLGFALLSLLHQSSIPPLSCRLQSLDLTRELLGKCKGQFLRMAMPAVCSQMAKLIAGVDKEHHQILAESIRILEIILSNAFENGETPDIATINNLANLLLGMKKAAVIARDCAEKKLTVLPEFRAFTRNLLSHLMLSDKFTRELVLLAYVSDLDISDFNQDSISIVLEKLSIETATRASDTGNPTETRIEAMSFLAWLESGSFSGNNSTCLEIIATFMEDEIDAQAAKRIVPVGSLTKDLFLTTHIDHLEHLNELGPSSNNLIRSFDKIVAANSDKKILIDALMTLRSKYPVSTLRLLGRCVKSCDTMLSAVGESIIDSALQIYLDADHQSVMLSRGLMHCLVDVSKELGPLFTPYWRFLLMDMLTWISSSDPLLASCGLTTFRIVCQNIQSHPLDVVRGNMDHIINHLRLQIRSPTVYPTAPRILTALLAISNEPSLLARIRNVLDEVMENLVIFRGHDGYVYELLGVLENCAKCLTKSNDGLIESNDNYTRDDDDDIKQSPQSMLAEKIVNIVVHFVLADRRKLRLRALTVLGELSATFRPYRDVFLPLVHLMWPVLLGRVVGNDEEESVRVLSLDTIAAVANVAGDFMQSRINQELWPSLAPKLLSKPSENMRIAVCMAFSQIAAHSKLSQKTVEGLALLAIDSIRMDSQPLSREAAVSLLSQLIKVSPDTMWFILAVQIDLSRSKPEGLKPYRRISQEQYEALSKPLLSHLIELTEAT